MFPDTTERESPMPAELENHGEHTSFAYNADRGAPWHRTGVPMKGYGTIDEMLAAAHADYEVRLEPTYVLAPDATGSLAPVETGRRATVRENPYTGATEVLADVGNRYSVLQNRYTLERAVDIVGASRGDAVVDTCGVLHDGRQFFAYLDLGTLVIDAAGINDQIARGLLVYNSHDGTVPLTYANTNERAVCKNTVMAGLRSARRTFKAKHTPEVEGRIDEANTVLALSTEWSRAFKEMAEQMLAIPMTADRFTRVLEAAVPLTTTASDRQVKNWQETTEFIRGVYANDRNAGFAGHNGWAAWNAVVEYLDHYRPATADERALTSMDDTSWVSKRKFAAQDAVLSYA
jgi:phage/plasmid-like protein (TIGR03299 family)